MRFLSSRAHTGIGLAAGVVLVLAPWALGFDDVRAAAWTAWAAGLFILVNEPMTTSPACPAPLQVVPMRLHLALDVVTGALLAASPWLLGFADESARTWVPHVVMGALVAGYALVTDTSDAVQAAGTQGVPPPAQAAPGRGQHR